MADDPDEAVDVLDDGLADPSKDYTFSMDPYQVEKVQVENQVQTLF